MARARADNRRLNLIAGCTRIATTADTTDFVLYERFVGGKRNTYSILADHARDLGYVNNGDSRDWCGGVARRNVRLNTSAACRGRDRTRIGVARGLAAGAVA